MHRWEKAGVARHPRWSGRYQQKRDLTENGDDQDAEEQIVEAATSERVPENEREQEGCDEVRDVHHHREHLERPRLPVVEVRLEPDRRVRAEADDSVDLELRLVMDR